MPSQLSGRLSFDREGSGKICGGYSSSNVLGEGFYGVDLVGHASYVD